MITDQPRVNALNQLGKPNEVQFVDAHGGAQPQTHAVQTYRVVGTCLLQDGEPGTTCTKKVLRVNFDKTYGRLRF